MAAGELEVAGFSDSKISAVTVAINCQVREPGIMLSFPAT